MRKRAREVAHTIVSVASEMSNHPFYIVTHADADGITAATIVTRILCAHKIQPNVVFTNSTEINEIVYHGTIKPAMKSQTDAKDGVWIFTDTGYTSHHVLEKIRKKIIIDHHQSNQYQMKNLGVPNSINCDSWTVVFSSQIFGVKTNACTASFLAYLIAKNVEEHKEAGALAVIGALGDGIYAREFTLTGLAREALLDAEAKEQIVIKKDLIVPGKETLSLKNLLLEMNQMLEMGFNAEEFVREIRDALKFRQNEIETVRWIEISPKERRKMLSWIAKKRIKMGHSPDAVLGMVGEVYHLKKHEPGKHIHDCAEFGKLLNDCGEKELGREAYELCLHQTEENYMNLVNKLYLR